jgi:N-acetylmuramoyl-L-alanine amidase
MRIQGRTGWRRWTLRLAPWLGAALLVWTICCVLWPDLLGLIESPLSPPAPPHRIPAGFDTVIIDPGHGGNDSGASAHGLQEKRISLDLAHRLSAELRNLGFTVVLTREDDTYVSLPDRVKFAQTVPAAIFVSLHCNYANNASARGFQIYRAESKRAAVPAVVQTSAGSEPLAISEAQLAGAIKHSLAEGLPCDHQEIRTANFFVLRNLDMPALLIECGFLTNPEDARALADPAFRTKLAGAIAKGIAFYRSSALPAAAQEIITVGDHPGKAGEAL